jgi:hypothetical protein
MALTNFLGPVLLMVAASAAPETASPPTTPAAEPPLVATPAAPSLTGDILPAKTVVEIMISGDLSSKTNKIGDMFTIRLAEPVKLGDRIILPAGTTGKGEVVHAARARWGGKAGEMILMARYLDCGNVKIPLGHFHFGGGGEARVGEAMAVGMVFTPAMFLVSGGEMNVPTGTRGNAQISTESTVPADVVGKCPSTQN